MLGAVGLVALLWLILAWPYLGYAPVRSDAWRWTVFHVHSTLSDGTGTPAEIARAAKAVGVSAVILADHGRPNLQATAFRETFGDVTVIGGSEANLPDGHLIGFGGIAVPGFWLPPWPPDALADLGEWGGLGAVAYPEDPVFGWQYWESDFRPDMLEVLNPSTMFRRLGWWNKTRLAAGYAASSYVFLDFLPPPAAELQRWDRLLQNGRVFALLGLNAHGGVHLGGDMVLPAPTYEAMFRLWAMGTSSAEKDTLAALRRGEFFCCLRGAAEPARLRFEAASEGTVYPAGCWAVPAGANLQLGVEVAGYATRLVLRRDGRMIRQTTGNELTLDGLTPGVYRAEIYLTDHPLLSADVPWILTSPLRVTAAAAGPAEPETPDRPPVQEEPDVTPMGGRTMDSGAGEAQAVTGGAPGDDGFSPDLQLVDPSVFRIEKDDRTTATFVSRDGVWTLDYDLAPYQEGGSNRWVALADRRNRDLSACTGFYARVWSDTYRRYFVEIRSGDRWYYASFKCYPGRETVCYVPFSRFYRVLNGRQDIPLAAIDSWFITQSNYTGPAGFGARLQLREVGFYR
jgi:hypothetical protein